MAEALAIVGLAGNIIQFIDFGIKLVSKSVELYHAADGTLKENVSLEAVAIDIKLLIERLSGGSTVGANAATLRLMELAKIAQNIADELVANLKALQLPASTSKRWRSFQTSLYSIWKGRNIREIEDRLWKIRNQISFHLLVTLEESQHSSVAHVSQNSQSKQAADQHGGDALKRMKGELIECIKQSRAESSRQQQSLNLKHLDVLLKTINDFNTASASSAKVYAILASLHFKQIKTRQSEIKAAHAQTFEWIFSDTSAHKFRNWLESDGGIFWVSGKAGSGKSTLMKFIATHHKTNEALQIWAGSHQEVLASFYFWALGTPLQNTQEDLLRTILYQILSQSPQLISSVCSDRWNLSDNVSFQMSEAWPFEELSTALSRFAALTYLPIRLCILIDGLDEYEGTHSDMLATIEMVAKSPYIKVCVSSRPWPIFNDGLRNCPMLHMQDLTKADMKLYIDDIFVKQAIQTQFVSNAHDCDSLAVIANQIQTHSQGVFLWVTLVVQSLLRGLGGHDNLSELQRRLDTIPHDLDDYFHHIFSRIDPIYHKETALIFTAMLQASFPLPLMFFPYLRDNKEAIIQLTSNDGKNESPAIITELLWYQKRRIHARCLDLVEAPIGTSEDQLCKAISSRPDHVYTSYCATFVHRTVQEFLRTPRMKSILSAWIGRRSLDSALFSGVQDLLQWMPSSAEYLRVAHIWVARAIDLAHRLQYSSGLLCWSIFELSASQMWMQSLKPIIEKDFSTSMTIPTDILRVRLGGWDLSPTVKRNAFSNALKARNTLECSDPSYDFEFDLILACFQPVLTILEDDGTTKNDSHVTNHIRNLYRVLKQTLQRLPMPNLEVKTTKSNFLLCLLDQQMVYWQPESRLEEERMNVGVGSLTCILRPLDLNDLGKLQYLKMCRLVTLSRWFICKEIWSTLWFIGRFGKVHSVELTELNALVWTKAGYKATRKEYNELLNEPDSYLLQDGFADDV